MLKEGTTAPAFTTKNGNGEPVKLKDFRGQKVVLYFYPKTIRLAAQKRRAPFEMVIPSLRSAT